MHCHGCVPGCCSCPCSAPPASANGAKVSGAVVALSATPLGDCVYLSWAPETPALMWRAPAVCFSCCSPSPQLLVTSLATKCCFAASFHSPGKTSISPWDQPFSHLPLCFPHPWCFLADNRCVLSRAKSCTECIRVDKDCSFCTDEVRPLGLHFPPCWWRDPTPLSGTGTREQGQLWIQLLFWMGEAAVWISFWCRKWGGRRVQGRIAAMQGFIRKCHSTRNSVCKGWGESFIPQNAVTHWRSHFSWWFSVRFVPISLPPSCPKGSQL